MANKSSKTRSEAKSIVKIVLLIILALILIAAAVLGIFFATGGFSGTYATFITTINGTPYIASDSVDLPSGSEIVVNSFWDYSFSVVVVEPAEDFGLTVGEDSVLFSSLAGEDITAAFTFTESDGIITVEYSTLEEILSYILGDDVTVAQVPDCDLFTLVVTSGDSSLELNFNPLSDVRNITLDPGAIIF